MKAFRNIILIVVASAFLVACACPPKKAGKGQDMKMHDNMEMQDNMKMQMEQSS